MPRQQRTRAGDEPRDQLEQRDAEVRAQREQDGERSLVALGLWFGRHESTMPAGGVGLPSPVCPLFERGTTVGMAAEIPAHASLRDLAAAAAKCTACELYERATQTVFGEGPAGARVMLVGEQPGDVEDRRGEPFVGPAGKMLDRALDDAGLARAEVYLTNAVKHFRWKSTAEVRGYVIHQRANRHKKE